MAGLVLVTSLMAVVYIWRVVEVAYFQDAPDEAITEAPLALLIPTWVLILANFYFGIDGTFTIELAGNAARALIGIVP